MKKKASIKVALTAFLLIFLALPSAHAVLFRMLDGRALGKAASTNGSMAFKAKVLRVEQSGDSLAITFQVQDALKGKVKTGDVITQRFPNPKFSNNLRISDASFTPQVEPNAEGVFFVTTRALDGKAFLIGGDQGQYYLAKEGGKSVVYNRLGNANFFSNPQSSSNSLVKKVVQGMQERNSGAITYEDFKQLINQ